MELKRKGPFFLIILLIFFLIGIVYADWTIDDEWTVSDEWTIAEAANGNGNGEVGTFKVYVEDTGSVGFQNTPDHNVTLTVSSGTLNSSDSSLSMEYRRKRGVLTVNSSTEFTLDFDYSDTTLYLSTQINSGDWIPRDKGTSLAVNADSQLGVQWRERIFNPFDEYVNLYIGLGGLGLMVLSSFFVAKKAREFGGAQDLSALGISFVGVLIGAGLILVWLW